MEAMGGGEHRQHVLCALPYPEPKGLTARLQEQFPGLKVTYEQITKINVAETDQGLAKDLWKDVTVLFTLNALPPKPELAPKLELLQMYSAGINHIEKHPLYTSTSIPICTSSGIHGPTIAEWVIMTLLVGTHRYNMLHEWQQHQSWGPPDGGGPHARSTGLNTVRDLASQRLGVLGYGSIGRQVGRVARALGMDVVAYTASPRDSPDAKRDAGYIVPGTGDPDGSVPSRWFSGLAKEDLHAFLAADLDVLVVSLPLTAKTRHLLGADEFALLARRNAFVANISRGQILQQDALIAALHAFADDAPPPHPAPGQARARRAGLRGAALDVADPEPLPQGHPLFSTPNCIVTPHISGLSAEYAERAFDVLRANLERWGKGEGLLNRVDRKKGY